MSRSMGVVLIFVGLGGVFASGVTVWVNWSLVWPVTQDNFFQVQGLALGVFVMLFVSLFALGAGTLAVRFPERGGGWGKPD